MNEYLSLSQLRQLTQERMQVKLYKNDEMTLTPQSNRSQFEAVESLELQWQSIRRQNIEQRSCSRSPAKNNLMNHLRNKQQQCILKKVVPLSTINLRVQETQPKNHLKDSSHFQYIANKYCNIYRRPSPEVNQVKEQRNQIQSHSYQRNNLKVLDERVRVNSQDKYTVLSQSNITKKEGPQRKRVSQYEENRVLTNVKQAGMQNLKIMPKKK